MKKPVISLLILFFSAQLISAQKIELWAKSSDKGLYLEHKVMPRESFFSLGRKYNVHPRSLAVYNNLDINKGLFIDQKLRIPLNDTNFSQKANSGTPVYYKVKDKEGLMTVSSKHQNVSMASLRTWNNLTGNDVKKDTKLIIGFLQSNEMPAITITTKPKTEEPLAKVEDNKNTDPVVTVKKEDVPDKKAEEKKAEPVIIKPDIKPALTEFGYFKPQFDLQSKKIPPSKNETVTAGIFKTTSGWQDSKYYLLMDQLQPGTIVKIINPGNNKAVYAKVLGQMSGIRQNEGLDIRISNAAASILEITESDKFIVNVNY